MTNETHNDTTNGINRRTFLQTTGAAGATLAVGSGVGPDRLSPVGSSDALGPIAIAVGAAAFGAAAGWTVRETGIIGGDSSPPPDGLGPDALNQEAYRSLSKRIGTLQSTLVDNRNLLKASTDTAFSEAKLAAISALNDQKPQADVTAAGQAEVDKYYDEVRKNLLKSIRELISEIVSWIKSFREAGIDTEGPFNITANNNAEPTPFKGWNIKNEGQDNQYLVANMGFGSFEIKPTGISVTAGYNNNADIKLADPEGNSKTWHLYDGKEDTKEHVELDWPSVLSEIETQRQNAKNDIGVWVSNIYGDVQSGRISTAELRGPSEIATQLSDNQSNATAVGDLLALNVPGSYGDNVTVEYESTEPNLGTTRATGPIANSQGATVSEGETIDPSNTPGDWYLSAKIGSLRTEWTKYNNTKGVDGGLIEFTANPVNVGQQVSPSDVVFSVSTSKGETVRVAPDEFVEKDQEVPITWEADLSDKLNSDIAEIEKIEVFVSGASSTDTAGYQNIRLTETFTVIRTPAGQDVDFTKSPRTPQTDTNYRTQEEWEQEFDGIETQIESYEEAKAAAGGGSLFGGDFGLDGLPSLPGLSTLESGVIVAFGAWISTFLRD
mgnify:CR=1 FL=1